MNQVLTSARLSSTNFLSDVMSFVIAAVGAVTMVTTDFDLGLTWDAVIEQNWDYILTFSVPALITFATKVVKNIKEKTFSFKALLQSKNAITKFLVVFSGIMTFVNVMLPADMPEVLSTAIESGNIAAIITAVVATIINPIWHILFVKDKTPTTDDANV